MTNPTKLCCHREIPFNYDYGHYRFYNKDEPEHAIAFDETYVRKTFKKNNLEINIPILYGIQDVVMATKITPLSFFRKILNTLKFS